MWSSVVKQIEQHLLLFLPFSLCGVVCGPFPIVWSQSEPLTGAASLVCIPYSITYIMLISQGQTNINSYIHMYVNLSRTDGGGPCLALNIKSVDLDQSLFEADFDLRRYHTEN